MPRMPAARVATAMTEPGPVLFWVRTGVGEAEVNGAGHRLGPGQAIWVPAGSPHILSLDADAVGLPILLPPIEVPERLDRVLTIDVPEAWQDWLVYQFARNLGYLDDAARAGSELLRLVHAAPSVQAVPSHPAALPPPVPWSPAACEVARELLRTPDLHHDLARLAAGVRVSVRTLQRHFADETGLTFARWRARARIAAAARHLDEGRSVAWTAQRVGFSSTSGLSHAFRAQIGMAPSQYRRRAGRTAPSAAAPRRTGAQPPVPPAIPAERSWSRINSFDVLLWVHRGTAAIEVAGRTRRLRRGDAVLVPAGMRISVRIDERSLLLPLSVRAGGGPPPATPPKVVHLPLTAEDYLLRTMVSNYTILRPERHDPAQLAEVVHALAPQRRRERRWTGDIGAITQAVRVDPADRRGLADWAAELDRDLDSLRKEFVAATGETFPRWRGRLRMTTARELIDAGVPPVAVARRLGYASLAGFSKVFSAAFGASPREHRRRGETGG